MREYRLVTSKNYMKIYCEKKEFRILVSDSFYETRYILGFNWPVLLALKSKLYHSLYALILKKKQWFFGN